MVKDVSKTTSGLDVENHLSKNLAISCVVFICAEVLLRYHSLRLITVRDGFLIFKTDTDSTDPK